MLITNSLFYNVCLAFYRVRTADFNSFVSHLCQQPFHTVSLFYRICVFFSWVTTAEMHVLISFRFLRASLSHAFLLLVFFCILGLWLTLPPPSPTLPILPPSIFLSNRDGIGFFTLLYLLTLVVILPRSEVPPKWVTPSFPQTDHRGPPEPLFLSLRQLHSHFRF